MARKGKVATKRLGFPASPAAGGAKLAAAMRGSTRGMSWGSSKVAPVAKAAVGDSWAGKGVSNARHVRARY